VVLSFFLHQFIAVLVRFGEEAGITARIQFSFSDHTFPSTLLSRTFKKCMGLLSKSRALSSNPSTAKPKKKSGSLFFQDSDAAIHLILSLFHVFLGFH
jgi:hypothetical protein